MCGLNAPFKKIFNENTPLNLKHRLDQFTAEEFAEVLTEIVDKHADMKNLLKEFKEKAPQDKKLIENIENSIDTIKSSIDLANQYQTKKTRSNNFLKNTVSTSITASAFSASLYFMNQKIDFSKNKESFIIIGI